MPVVKLWRALRSLETREEVEAFLYFVENLSVGEWRALEELSRIGVSAEAVRSLLKRGFVESSRGSLNLAAELREAVYAERGGCDSVEKAARVARKLRELLSKRVAAV